MAGVTKALTVSRRATLEAMRATLAAILDGDLGHKRGCECECSAPFDAGKMAGISRELREITRELDDLPTESGGSEIASIQADREARRQQAQANAGARE